MVSPVIKTTGLLMIIILAMESYSFWLIMAGLFARNGVGALGLALAKREILARSFVERDHQVVWRHVGCRGNAGIDILQECEPRLLRPTIYESEIKDNQVVGVVHTDKRWCVQKAFLWKFEDKLVEVFGRHAKRVHQGRLNSA